MDREMIDRIKRHQGQETMHKIGEDEFPFKPLGWEYIGDFFALGRKNYTSGKEGEMFDEDTVALLKTLIFNFVKNSWDKPTEYNEESWDSEIRAFCANNFTKLTEIMFKTHNFEAEDVSTAKSSIQKINETRQRMDEIRAKSAESPDKEQA